MGSESENTYFIDPENGSEMARLLEQDKMLNANMGGLLPASLDISLVKDILDVACGPGGWALEMAAEYPRVC